MINLNCEVTTKKIGYPTVGTVLGLLHTEVFSQPVDRWREFYPDCDLIACVKFKQPQRTITREEYFASMPEEYKAGLTPIQLELSYLNGVPHMLYGYYPVEDLEPL